MTLGWTVLEDVFWGLGFSSTGKIVRVGDPEAVQMASPQHKHYRAFTEAEDDDDNDDETAEMQFS